jgi:twitching motility two-component system response regulator PilH
MAGDEILMAKVLVVEGDLTQQLITFKHLKVLGVSFSFAEDGVEALDRIQGDPPDLVILDIALPRMNGYEICRRLKANLATKGIPVLMYSTKAGASDLYWGSKQGADACLSKLCPPRELIDTVKRLLGEKLQQPLKQARRFYPSISANSSQRSVAASIA